MTIDKINQVNNIVRTTQTNDIKPLKHSSKKDSVKISGDAKLQAEFNRYVQMVKDAPDTRMDKISIAKKNIESYFADGDIKPEVLKTLTDRIAGSLGY